MANICTNQYRFIFGDEEKAKKFFDFIGGGNPDCSNNSVYNLGIAAKIENAEHRDVREWIDIEEISRNSVRVYSESKWTPCPNAWRDIARTFDENVEVFYEAEEPGCEIYDSNDPKLVGQYVYVFWDLPEGSIASYCGDAGVADEQQMAKILQDALNTKIQDLETLLNLIDEQGLSDNISVHRIEYLSIDDWAE